MKKTSDIPPAKDESLIPPGGICYRIVRIKDGEFPETNSERSGKELRELPYTYGFKRVLCPYWVTTDHGTVRCEFLVIEREDEGVVDAREKIIAHFGSLDIVDGPGGGYLYDEEKMCEVNRDKDMYEGVDFTDY